MGRRPEKVFFQRRYTYGQQAHEKVLNVHGIFQARVPQWGAIAFSVTNY